MRELKRLAWTWKSIFYCMNAWICPTFCVNAWIFPFHPNLCKFPRFLTIFAIFSENFPDFLKIGFAWISRKTCCVNAWILKIFCVNAWILGPLGGLMKHAPTSLQEHFLSIFPGVLHSSINGGVPLWDSKINGSYVGLNFRKSYARLWIGLKYLNFLILLKSPKRKRHSTIYEGFIFFDLMFLRPYLGLVEVKKGSLTASAL